MDLDHLSSQVRVWSAPGLAKALIVIVDSYIIHALLGCDVMLLPTFSEMKINEASAQTCIEVSRERRDGGGWGEWAPLRGIVTLSQFMLMLFAAIVP